MGESSERNSFRNVRCKMGKKTDVAFTLDLSIPVGCKATVLLPVKAKSVSINDVKSDKLDQLEIQSGNYRITCAL